MGVLSSSLTNRLSSSSDSLSALFSDLTGTKGDLLGVGGIGGLAIGSLLEKKLEIDFWFLSGPALCERAFDAGILQIVGDPRGPVLKFS